MKIKIDINGNLWIERAGKWKKQECRPGGAFVIQIEHPYDPPCEEMQYGFCCDACPLFGEPGSDMDHLHICGGTVLMPKDKIIDERQKGE